MAKLNCNAFYDYLFDRVPVYDEKIMATWDDPYLVPLRRDVRLLPNHLRRVYALKGSVQQRARQLRTTKWRYEMLEREATCLLLTRIDEWLARLPKRRRKREHKLRWHDPKKPDWIGQVSVGRWPSEPSRFERLRLTTAGWP